jgi:ABC-type dipeptide/oligopeptide/nickel transport system permease subunit
MLPNLIIIIALPIIMTIVSVSPFEPPQIEDEQIPETLVNESPESNTSLIIILLAIVWFFFVARMLKVLYTARNKSRIRK